MGHIIESNRKKLVILFGLLLATHSSIAQTGYNYPRPEVPLGTSGAALPTSTGSLVGFPTTAAGSFRNTPGYAGTVSPTSPSYGYTNPQLSDSAIGSTATGFAGSKRPIQSRTDGIFGAVGTGIGVQIPSQPQLSPITIPQLPLQPQIPLQAQPQPQPQRQPQPQPQPQRPQAQPQPQSQVQPQPQPQPQETEGDYSAIPGRPGMDYPIYSEVPATSFDCNEQEFPGFYADVQTQCQIFHRCEMNRTYSFICPNGTIFSQKFLVCVWYYMFDCNTAPELYANNKEIYDYSKPTETQPTPGAYPTASTRTQSSFQNTFRQPTGTGSGVYSTNLRPTVPSASYSGVSTGVAPIGTTAFPSSGTGSGRFTSPSSAATGGAFPTGPPTAAAGYATTRRTGFSPIPEATFPSPQVSPTTASREYLPPRRS